MAAEYLLLLAAGCDEEKIIAIAMRIESRTESGEEGRLRVVLSLHG
jgi:hypothetical protein